jgi:hypothetical protein
MAYEDLVEAAKLGSTVIDGGYIKTNLLTADNIVTGTLTGRTVQTASTGIRTILDSDNDRISFKSGSTLWGYIQPYNTGNGGITMNTANLGAQLYLFEASTDQIGMITSLGGSVYLSDDDIYISGNDLTISADTDFTQNIYVNGDRGLNSIIGFLGADGVTPFYIEFAEGIAIDYAE